VIAIGVTIHAHPHQATYFNLIGGGSPYHGLRVLADSNVDWGQDLMTAKRRVDELGYKRVNMDYFGSAQPHVYGFKDFNYIPATMKYDDKLPTVVSLHFLQYRRKDFPGYFDREPIAFCNSMVIFAPKSR
jgi:hypothetical protein